MRNSIGLVAVLAAARVATPVYAAEHPLPSWNEGPAKASILNFVAQVTDKGSPNYVVPAERIAVFDNDGTLWPEQPIYTQALFGIDQARAVASKHPEWKDREPFKSALAGDLKGLEATGVRGLIDLTTISCGGLTVGEFDRTVTDWLSTKRQPRFQRPYTDCVYQPMLEVLAFLRTNAFKTYIVSGGSLEFLRPWTLAVYGVPPEQVIGSTAVTKYEMRGGNPVLVRQPETEHLTDREEKAIAIQRVIGRRPIAAFGNSDGDLAMLTWTAAGSGRRFCLYVHHTDAKREWAYDRTAATGRLDKGLDVARANGWTVVDMQQDWKRVFPFDKTP
jgi:hypothetical protein